ncbi:MAG: YcgL domain-containing protein [Gammaproteobacteria bacterium]|nr:YcgL domain-containing protein [Gammaproteobacteria bacterium]MDH5629266.1 YcgL domain-containing protein [Gammaproteobacteria bacterium]
MLAFVYRSRVKSEMYLYIEKRDDFSSVPDALLKAFGKPEFSLQINLAKREKLSRVNIDEVKSRLATDGYFLQIPPQIESLLN